MSIGAHGVGGAKWSSHAALYLDFWVSALPAKATPGDLAPIYQQYADATGHAPPLRDTAKVFWQVSAAALCVFFQSLKKRLRHSGSRETATNRRTSLSPSPTGTSV